MQPRLPNHRSLTLTAAWILVAVAAASVSVGADDSRMVIVGHSEADGGAYLGVHLREEVDHEEGGAHVTEVVEGSPADDAGLREDDIVLEFDGHVVRGPAALTQRIHAREPGDRVSVVVDRKGERRTLEVELGEREPVIGMLSPGARTYTLDSEKLKEWSEHLHEQSKAWSDRAHEFSVAPRSWTYLFSGKPRLGVELVETTPELRKHLGGSENAGVLISRILRGTPAERSGLRVGDLIIAVADREIDDTQSLVRELDDLVGQTFPVRIVRGKKTMTIEVTIEEPDEDVPTGPRAHLRPLPPLAPLAVIAPAVPRALVRPVPAVAPAPPKPPVRPVPAVAPAPPKPPVRPVPAVAPAPPKPPVRPVPAVAPAPPKPPVRPVPAVAPAPHPRPARIAPRVAPPALAPPARVAPRVAAVPASLDHSV